MKTSILFGTTVLALTLSAGASPTDCDCNGAPGYILTVPPEIGVGEDFDLIIEAPGGSIIFHAASLGAGPLPRRWGCFCLDWPLLS